ARPPRRTRDGCDPKQKNRGPSGTGRGEVPPGTHVLPAHRPPATRQGRVMVMMMQDVVQRIHGPGKLPGARKPSRPTANANLAATRGTEEERTAAPLRTRGPRVRAPGEAEPPPPRTPGPLGRTNPSAPPRAAPPEQPNAANEE